MNQAEYRLKKEMLKLAEPSYRVLCLKCLQPQVGCYCAQIQSFDPKISFVILIHPIECRRRIATGRMSHLTLKESYLIRGQNYSNHETVNRLIQDPEYHSVILYPGVNSTNLSLMSAENYPALIPEGRKLRIFVIDGTWATARKMMRESENLKQLPKICFTPDKPSNFRVRKQPNENCYSTIEAIHQTIQMIGPTVGFNLNTRKHEALLNVFDFMVENQLEFIRQTEADPSRATYRRKLNT